MISIDIMGPFSETDKDNRWILCIGDLFTKYCVAVPLQNITAVTVTEALLSQWIAYFGVPLELHSDKGSQFESEIFSQACSILGIDKTRTTTMNPQSNGFIEHVNHTLCDFLNCIIQDNPFSWDLLIKLCMMAYNSAIQESTKETPNVMMFGRQSVLPIDLVMPDPVENKYENAQDFVLQLQRFMFEVHARARTNLKGAAKNQEKQYNNRLKFHTYEIGSFVYYYYPVKVNVSKESYLKWKGPYKIVSKVTDTLYRIKSGDGGKSFIVHYNKLKPAHKREDFPSVVQYVSGCGRPLRNRQEPDRLGEWITDF